jgi:hypothetical protein
LVFFNRKGRPLFDQVRPIPVGPLEDGDLAGYIDERLASPIATRGVLLPGFGGLPDGLVRLLEFWSRHY